jgi:hypothetical protein
MWHRYLINGLAGFQYLTSLIVGAVYYWLIAAFVGVTGGGLSFGIFFLLLVPLMLASFGGLAFFLPRIGAVVALVLALPIFSLGISYLFNEQIQAEAIFVIPSAIVILASIFSLLWSEGSVWRRLKTKFGRIAVVLIAAAPGLFAGYAIVVMLWYLLVTSRQGAT